MRKGVMLSLVISASCLASIVAIYPEMIRERFNLTIFVFLVTTVVVFFIFDRFSVTTQKMRGTIIEKEHLPSCVVPFSLQGDSTLAATNFVPDQWRVKIWLPGKTELSLEVDRDFYNAVIPTGKVEVEYSEGRYTGLITVRSLSTTV